jgi:hypothetical protein
MAQVGLYVFTLMADGHRSRCCIVVHAPAVVDDLDLHQPVMIS